MMSFRQFLELKIRGVNYRPNCVPSAKVFRPSGPEKMNLFKAIAPSRPYQPIFRLNKKQPKSGIMGKKH